MFIDSARNIKADGGHQCDRTTLDESLAIGIFVVILASVDQKLLEAHLTAYLLNSLERLLKTYGPLVVLITDYILTKEKQS